MCLTGMTSSCRRPRGEYHRGGEDLAERTLRVGVGMHREQRGENASTDQRDEGAGVPRGEVDGQSVRLGVVRSISYGLFGTPDSFVPEARKLGARLLRVYFYWSQIEPQPGDYDFSAVDALLDQLDGSEEVWVTVCSSSMWATQVPTTFLPPSAAKDPATYREFVTRLVRHCAGRVHLWQCDNEPSNVGLTWAGSAAEYVVQLRSFYEAVKGIDPSAAVVLGGAPFGLPAAGLDSAERQFFEVLLRDGRETFDLFDLHLYQQAERIPDDVETVRKWMRELGYERPIVAGEYNAPWPSLYPEAESAMNEAMAAAFAPPGEGEEGSTPQAGAAQRTPEQLALAGLYERMSSLPPQLQMFMHGCPPELEDKRDRINCREIIMRNLLALSAGVRRTACWNLAPDIPGYEDHLSIMDLLFGKLAIMRYDGGVLWRRPAADTFALLCEMLDGAEGVDRKTVSGSEGLFVFEVQRPLRGPLLVVWEQRDPFTGEDEAPVRFDWPWPHQNAQALDAFGAAQAVDLRDGRVSLRVSDTPVFLSGE